MIELIIKKFSITQEDQTTIESLPSIYQWSLLLRACSAFYWDACPLSEPKALSGLALPFPLYI